MKFPDNVNKLKIAVIGDVMLDRYWWGSVERISPEAPVPIVRLSKSSVVAGGAANVAANIAGLGASVDLIGICGKDAEAKILNKLLDGLDRVKNSVVTIAGRPTTIKTRIVANGQHVARIDYETAEPLNENVTNQLLPKVVACVAGADAIIISDYAKGFLTKKIIGTVIEQARADGKMVFVDPKSRNIARYRGATVITPNLKEATEATLSNDVIKAGKHLMNDKMSDAILITEGENGMTLFEKAAKPIHFDALALDIFDVTGAGDTVIAAFAVAAASGCAFSEAARIANIAASIAVGHIGTTVVTSEQIKEFCSDAAVASSS